jgi:tetratricopeptide (TPR) repeat protein
LRTKIKPAKKFTKFAFALLALIYLSACKPAAERLYSEATVEIEKGHFRLAADLLIKSSNVEKDPLLKYRYMTEAARLVRFEIQDYERAIRIYREIILSSQNENQRISSQESIAEIYLENIQNYSLALEELQILEPLIKDEEKKEKTQMRIAQAFYLTGNYQQALEEINTSLPHAKLEKMNVLKLKAQVLTAQKKYKEALDIYEQMRTEDLKYFTDENLFITTSVVFEENEDFAGALAYLNKYEKFIKEKAYLDLRYKKLKERLVNKPLFQGKRK